ncbi:MAG TPA: hypothetical protein VFW35_09695 [Sphingomicrobium sp.]|nr:hypothetical protein [Sphingomicrobium sp.]
MSELGEWKRRTATWGLLLLILTAWAARLRAHSTALYLVQSQDVPVLFLASLSMFVVALWRPQWSLPARPARPLMLMVAGAAIAGLLAWATYALLGNFPLSRDEHMVVFDMAVFDKGMLAVPLASEWRPYALALVPKFLLNSNQPIGLVSGYLPMNAALRLAFSKVADPAWFNPLLVLAGGAALFDIARRTFGAESRACWAVLLVYALSAQVLVNAMTTFSMTGHLAFNLIWLAAFLRGGKWGHLAAILTAFIATGLHQLVFHPFFAAPFLLWKLREGQWKLVLAYAAAYAAIILWWAAYPILVSPLVAGPAGHASDANFISQRVIPLLMNRDPRTVPLTILNLLRFVAWQNVALWSLLIAGVPVALRERGLARALLLGIVLWIVFLAVVLPEQGRGWGYRYLNGYEGSFALLAGYGYRELEGRIGRQADGMVLLLSAATLVAAIPALFATSYRFMQPHLAMQRMIEAQGTPFVVIDDSPTLSFDRGWRDTAQDHVRNLPDLSNRPLRFSGSVLTPGLLIELCRRGPVTIVTRADMHRLGFLLNVQERSPDFERLVASAKPQAPGCIRAARVQA